jgi:hypothetical protein
MLTYFYTLARIVKSMENLPGVAQFLLPVAFRTSRAKITPQQAATFEENQPT